MANQPLTAEQLRKMVLSGKYDDQYNVRNVVAHTQQEAGMPVTQPQYLVNQDNVSVPPVPYQQTQPPPQPYQQSSFQPTMPQPKMMTLEEMMDIVNRRVELMTEPQLRAMERGLEEEQLSGERRKGEIEAAYEGAQSALDKNQAKAQQATTQTMARRNVYDSGMAIDLANRLERSGMQMGLELNKEQARTLADLAEYLDLRTRHTQEEMQALIGEKAIWAQSLLDEMHMRQQERGDMLAQREFENWLAQEHFNMQQRQMDFNEYWRGTEFDAGQSQQEWERWAWDQQFGEQQRQAAWNRIMEMNRFDLEKEIQRLLANNQMTQWEADYALRLNDQAMQEAVYRAQFP